MGTPPKRALKVTASSPKSSPTTEIGEMFRIIWPSLFTCCCGTSTPAPKALTNIYGVQSLSTIHSYNARIIYGRLDVMDIEKLPYDGLISCWHGERVNLR